jgi:hypothetical protein
VGTLYIAFAHRKARTPLVKALIIGSRIKEKTILEKQPLGTYIISLKESDFSNFILNMDRFASFRAGCGINIHGEEEAEVENDSPIMS